MKILILFSAWAAGKSSDEIAWLSFYSALLRTEFETDDKIIAINCGSSGIVHETFSDIPASRVVSTPEHLKINSDASGYQACLNCAASLLLNYDVVLFLHTKGVSYSFDGLAGLRASLLETILNRSRIEKAFAQPGSRFVGDRGHMPQTPPSCVEVIRAATLLDLPPHSFTFAATYTLFAASATCVEQVMRHKGNYLVSNNLVDLGFNRFFFEGSFASLISHEAEQIEFLGGAEFSSDFSTSVSADHLPKHNSAMVMKEFKRYCEDRHRFTPKCYPYVFGQSKELENIRISFDI